MAATASGEPGVAASGAGPVARPLRIGFIDERLLSQDQSTRSAYFANAVSEKADIIRIPVRWRDVAPSRPTDPTDPFDPAYHFAAIDSAVRDATANAMQIVFTVYRAPAWAEASSGRPAGVATGTWRPNASAFGEFATALARRYSGETPDPLNVGQNLPRVGYWEAWNEPNLSSFLGPQRRGNRVVSAAIYRKLLNAFYDGVKSVHPDNLVLGPATAPYGGNAQRTRPMRFLRALFCLKRATLTPTPCPGGKPKLDILSHHPINAFASPLHKAHNPDDASSADMGKVRRLLRAAEQAGNVIPAGRRDIWVSEFWWFTNPPQMGGFSPRTQARWIEQALFLWWKHGISAAINFNVRDTRGLATGVFYGTGTPKPAARAMRFPFVARRVSKQRMEVWGRAPVAGTLRIQSLNDGVWHNLKHFDVGAEDTFDGLIQAQGPRQLHALVGGETSLRWVEQ